MAHLLSTPCDNAVRLLCRTTAGTRTKRRSLRADECRQDHAHLLLRLQARFSRRHHLGHRGEARRQRSANPRMGWHLQKSQQDHHKGGDRCFIQRFPIHQHSILVAMVHSPHKHRRTPKSQHLRGEGYELYVRRML